MASMNPGKLAHISLEYTFCRLRHDSVNILPMNIHMFNELYS